MVSGSEEYNVNAFGKTRASVTWSSGSGAGGGSGATCDYREFCPYLNQHACMLVAQLAADLVSEPAIVPTIALDLDDREPLRPHSRRVVPRQKVVHLRNE